MSKVTNEMKVTFANYYYSSLIFIYLVFFCMPFSCQCPTVYQEEMGRNMERSDQEQNNGPTERSLIILHKKV